MVWQKLKYLVILQTFIGLLVVAGALLYVYQRSWFLFIINFLGQQLGWSLGSMSIRTLTLKAKKAGLGYAVFYGCSCGMMALLFRFPFLNAWGLSRVLFGFCNAGVWILSEQSIANEIAKPYRSYFFSLYLAVYHLGGLLAQFSMVPISSMRQLYRPQHISGGMLACFFCYALLPKMIDWCSEKEVNASPSFARFAWLKHWSAPFNPLKWLWSQSWVRQKRCTSEGVRRPPFWSVHQLRSKYAWFIRRGVATGVGALCALFPLLYFALLPRWQQAEAIGQRYALLGGLMMSLGIAFAGWVGWKWPHRIHALSALWRLRLNLASLAFLVFAILKQSPIQGLPGLTLLFLVGALGYDFYPSMVLGIQAMGEGKSTEELIAMMDSSLTLANHFFAFAVISLRFLNKLQGQDWSLDSGEGQGLLIYFLNGYFYIMLFCYLPERVLVGMKRKKTAAAQWLKACPPVKKAKWLASQSRRPSSSES